MVSELNSLKINSGWGKTSFGGEASSVLQEVRIVCLEIPSEMEVAPHYTLLTLFITVQTAFHYLDIYNLS